MIDIHEIKFKITRDDAKRIIGQFPGSTLPEIASKLNCKTIEISSDLTDMVKRKQITRTRPISKIGEPKYPYQYWPLS